MVHVKANHSIDALCNPFSRKCGTQRPERSTSNLIEGVQACWSRSHTLDKMAHLSCLAMKISSHSTGCKVEC